ncbi:MAG: hypothetical protein H0U74_15365 [Bradymonadaceae bacterium]|nr:hypothetical protein [Lujinxingiaceae bacterium]
MWKNALVGGLVFSVLGLSVAACSSSDETSTAAPAASVGSGFDFQTDAFTFANFGGEGQGPQLTPNLVARMFGPEEVCAFGTLPCTLNPVAEGWMKSTNGTLAQGRSEGFAITSLLFHSGVLDPNDFGAPTVAELTLFGNKKLQEEFAYWAATQAVPSVLNTNERYQAKDVIPFLIRALDPKSEKHYRLAIAQRTETGFARGHALTPIGYFRDAQGVYWLRVYDNNFPNNERRIEINPAANTWRYTVPPIEGDEPIVYEGSAENGNYLYFAAVEDRLGVLKAPFAADSQVRSLTYSSVSLVAKLGERETGIRGGEILEAEGDRVMPAFSRCPRCGSDVPIINQVLIAQGVAKDAIIEIETAGTVVTRTGLGDTEKAIGLEPGDGDVDWVSATGAGFTSTVYPQGDTSQDKVTFAADGSTSYTSASGEGVTISTQINRGDGVFEEVTVYVEGSGDPDKPVVVRVVIDADGGAKVEVDNLPEGSEVTVSVKRTEDDKTTFAEDITYKSNGDTSTVSFGSGDAAAVVTNGTDVQSASCTNGEFDSGFETDVDCGGSVCEPCQATSNQATTPQCIVASDCNTALCLDGRCRIKQPVIIRVNRLPDVSDPNTPVNEGIPIMYELDGVSTRFLMQADSVEGPFEFELGNAYQYQVTSVQHCAADYALQTTGLNAPQDQEPRGIIEVKCPEDGSRTIYGKVIYNPIRTPPLTPDNPVIVWLNIDGTAKEVPMSGTALIVPGFFSESWQAAVKTNPSKLSADGQYYECAVPPYYSNSGDFYSPDLLVECKLAAAPTCSDGRRNQDESGVDCGGVCAACADGASCWLDSDCLTGATCVARVCTSSGGTCSDGVLNQDETDMDCGGQRCGTCDTDKICQVGTDCTSKVCQGNVCMAPTCSDGAKNQNETDLDCGGSCSPCAVGEACLVAADCASQRCGALKVCDAGTCTDNRRNQDESDIDCGGTMCGPCGIGKICNQNDDCGSSACTGGLCVASCTDGIQNQDEIGVDCGGSFCTACPSGAACTLDSDCPSNNCECAANSGNCTGASGQCGGPKLVADLPTTDGVATSATLTVPAACTQVYVQAWGAAGGSGSSGGGGGGGFGTPGGAAGYVSGTLTVAAGDVINVWVGQGGNFGNVSLLGGDPGVGSKYGVATRGGKGDGGAFTGGGGGGGGLTSVQVMGANPASFVIPAGGGGTAFAQGEDVESGSGGGATDSNGESSPVGFQQAGGGAGEEGGSSDGVMGASGGAGTYGTYPGGFSTADGSFGVPANTSAPDYLLCKGLSDGDIGAGSNDGGSGFDNGGDGCVVLRCVAP